MCVWEYIQTYVYLYVWAKHKPKRPTRPTPVAYDGRAEQRAQQSSAMMQIKNKNKNNENRQERPKNQNNPHHGDLPAANLHRPMQRSSGLESTSATLLLRGAGVLRCMKWHMCDVWRRGGQRRRVESSRVEGAAESVTKIHPNKSCVHTHTVYIHMYLYTNYTSACVCVCVNKTATTHRRTKKKPK